MALSFLEIQNAVMTDRFDEAQRGDVKNWINDAYEHIWGLEEWTFREATDLVTVAANSQTVSSVPTDLIAVRSFQRGDGVKLEPLDPVTFNTYYYNPRSVWTSLPEAYTNVNGSLYVGPASNESATDYQIVYEKAFTPLSADADIPVVPGLILVRGAATVGLMLQNDFSWQFFEQQMQGRLEGMRRIYLSNRRDTTSAYPSDPIGD